jgi:hypothetical protein
MGLPPSVGVSGQIVDGWYRHDRPMNCVSAVAVLSVRRLLEDQYPCRDEDLDLCDRTADRAQSPKWKGLDLGRQEPQEPS